MTWNDKSFERCSFDHHPASAGRCTRFITAKRKEKTKKQKNKRKRKKGLKKVLTGAPTVGAEAMDAVRIADDDLAVATLGDQLGGPI